MRLTLPGWVRFKLTTTPISERLTDTTIVLILSASLARSGSSVITCVLEMRFGGVWRRPRVRMLCGLSSAPGWLTDDVNGVALP